MRAWYLFHDACTYIIVAIHDPAFRMTVVPELAAMLESFRTGS